VRLKDDRVNMANDYYKTLGVLRNASQAEIQKAYRDLARKYHPDMNPDDKGATKKFQEIQAAFDVLNNPEKREMYDRYGSSFETMGAGGPQGGHAWGAWPGAEYGGSPGGFTTEDIDFGQFFGERFGGPGGGAGDVFEQFRRASGQQRPRKAGATARRGADIVHELQISFGTAISGGEQQISVDRPSGKTETIAVKIPAGIEDGKKIRIRGQGEPGPRRGTPGDIILTIRVAPHPFFHRVGNSLHVRVPVTLAEAALGAKVDVPTPHGTVSLTVPPATSSGTKLRVKGHGVSSKSGTTGDLLAEIQIVLPKNLSEADRRAVAEIDGRYPQNPRANLHW
jgi:DnaJ-class molecular chaperone